MRSLGTAFVLAVVTACLSCSGEEVFCHGADCSAVPRGSMETVFDDTLAPNWQTLVGWSNCQPREEAVTGRDGGSTTAVRVATSGDFAGFWFARSDAPNWQGNQFPASATDYDALRAWVLFTDTTGVSETDVTLGYGASGISATVHLGSYVPVNPAVGRWYELIIPMADFQVPSGQTFICLGLQFGNSSMGLYLDDVGFELAFASGVRALDAAAGGLPPRPPSR